MSPLLMTLAGAVAGTGTLLLGWALLAPDSPTSIRVWATALFKARLHGRSRQLAVTALAGVGMWAVTGWPVAGALTAAGAWWLPRVLGPDTATRGAVERIEAVAAWAEMLRDMIAGASGLQHAITASAPIAPEAIRADVQQLADRLHDGSSTEQVFTAFAHRLAVPTGDLVAIALAAAADGHAADVGATLARLAEAARDRATTLARIAASRARLRSSTRIIIATSAAMVLGLILVNRPFLAPYATPAGQLVLLGVGGIWAASLAWLARMGRPQLGTRILVSSPRTPVEVAR